MNISDQLRQAVRDCGLSQNRLAKAAGVSQQSLNRFMLGYQVRSDHFDKLAAHLALELSPKRKKRRK